MEAITNFKRIEKKYLLTGAQYEALLLKISPHITPDAYGRSTVLSLYLDTPDHRIIRNSIEADNYKEKLRLRSYGTASAETRVFLELKKKFDGVVYKRREVMTLRQAEAYIKYGIKPCESQIMNEIDWAMRFYDRPRPAMMISCEREAWFDEEHPNLRLTFDRGIRFRESNLSLSLGPSGNALLPDDCILLEIKTSGAMPLWLADALDEEHILPDSFSKYGTAYAKALEKKNHPLSVIKGGIQHVVNF